MLLLRNTEIQNVMRVCVCVWRCAMFEIVCVHSTNAVDGIYSNFVSVKGVKMGGEERKEHLEQKWCNEHNTTYKVLSLDPWSHHSSRVCVDILGKFSKWNCFFWIWTKSTTGGLWGKSVYGQNLTYFLNQIQDSKIVNIDEESKTVSTYWLVLRNC